MSTALHPRQALFDPGEPVAPLLPVCDHYAGVEDRMRKSLALQARLGPVFDVTLDNEDGAPVGGEVEHARLIASLLDSPDNRHGRVGVRVLPVAHPRFSEVLRTVVRAGAAHIAPLAANYFNMRKTTIYGGSNEVQRNIVAATVLGS